VPVFFVKVSSMVARNTVHETPTEGGGPQDGEPGPDPSPRPVPGE